ncbi:hypothetical protein NUSPORA_02642 [Nucleospora cyclopteri]
MVDRTREYKKMVETTEIPQIEEEKSDFGREYAELESELEVTLTQIEKTTDYERFKIHPLLEKASQMLNDLKTIKYQEMGTEDSKTSIEGINNIIKTQTIRYTLRYNKLCRRLKEKTQKTPTETKFNGKPVKKEYSNEQQQILLENKQNVYVERMHERKRIVSSITEIGQIVEDIHLHVCLQEEQLRRIDDIVGKTDHFGKKTLNDLRETWEMLSGRRKNIIKFFCVWIFIILFFYFMKKRM